MDDNNDDVRQNLYDEFESEIVKAGNNEAFFDENDLIEIFDYASDLDNYIVKMEVLLYGARHYPDSQALATRRAWFYSSIGAMDAASDVNNRVTEGGVLNKLLELRASGAGDTPETRGRLDGIVAGVDDFADEELIQLVDFCSDNLMLDWIEDNRPLIQSKCSYPQTFLYEYAGRLEDECRYEEAAELFEELTMLEPFTIDFWERLAAVQFGMSDLEAVLSTVDYALAIDPKAVEARRLKGTALYRLERDMDTVIAIFKELVNEPEPLATDVTTLAGALVNRGDMPAAIQELKSFLDRYPAVRGALDVLMAIDFTEAKPYYKDYIVRDDVSVETLVDWVKSHLQGGRIEVAAAMLVTYGSIRCLLSAFPIAIETAYMARRYDDVIEMYEAVAPDWDDHDPRLVLPYVMSLVRKDRKKDALGIVNDNLDKVRAGVARSEYSTSGLMAYSPSSRASILVGYTVILSNIARALEAPDVIPADDFDPMAV